jgi:hypothetical protein
MINAQKAPWSFETSGTIHHTTLHHIIENVIPEKDLCENLKYRTMYRPPYIFRVTDTFTDNLGTLALLHAQPALYLCVLYDSRSKQMALTEPSL